MSSLSAALEDLVEELGGPPLVVLPLLDFFALGQSHDLAEGELLWEQGAPADSLALLLVGRIAVGRTSEQGVSRELAILRAPAVLGHVGLADGGPRSASCRAQSPVRLVKVSRALFLSTVEGADPMGEALRGLVLALMAQQLSATSATVRKAMFQGDLKQRP
jgi:CRP/FNR family transcriptional regulator, cyclic AMP receptor protein